MTIHRYAPPASRLHLARGRETCVINCGGGQAKYNVKSISVLHFEEKRIKWEFAQFGGQHREKDLIVWPALKRILHRVWPIRIRRNDLLTFKCPRTLQFTSVKACTRSVNCLIGKTYNYHFIREFLGND